MLTTLSVPEVLRCYFEDGFAPALSAMCLSWPDDHSPADRIWELPEGVSMVGPPPQRFGLDVRRHAADTYSVRLVWDRTCLSWQALTRAQLLGSCLSPLLSALGTDLWSLLDQPIRTIRGVPRRAA